jgi:hypothetical protein
VSNKKGDKIIISVRSPILPGTISTATSKCGSKKCACKGNPPKLHGPYYRWTGLIDGKHTTKTISKEIAEECERRISNYRVLQEEIKSLVLEALKNAPWQNKSEKS